MTASNSQKWGQARAEGRTLGRRGAGGGVTRAQGSLLLNPN